MPRNQVSDHIPVNVLGTGNSLNFTRNIKVKVNQDQNYHERFGDGYLVSV